MPNNIATDSCQPLGVTSACKASRFASNSLFLGAKSATIRDSDFQK